MEPTWLVMGERVIGTYLGHPFEGRVTDISFEAEPLGRYYRIQFDRPVEVAKPPLSNARRGVRVLLTLAGHSVDAKGRPDRLMVISRAAKSG